MFSTTIDTKNSLWLAIQFSSSLVFSLIGLKVNLISFGNDIFSIWLLLISIWGVGTVLDLGFGISIIKFIAQSKSNPLKTRDIISTSLLLFQSLGLIIFVLCCVIAEYFYFPNKKIIPSDLSVLSKTVFLILGCNFYILYITNVFKSVFEGHNRFIITSKISIFYNFANLAGSLLVLTFKLNLAYLALFILISSAIQLGLFIILYIINFPNLRIKLFYFNSEIFKEIFSFSFAIQSAYLLGALIDPLIKYLLGNFSEKRLIPSYEIAKKFSWAISGLFSFTFRNSLPKTSTLNDKEEYRSFLYSYGVNISRFSIIYSAVFFGILSFFIAIIFQFFYKNNDCLMIFFIFSLSESVNNAGYIIYILIIGMGRAFFLTLVQLTNLIFTTTFLILGFLVFNNTIGLLGYFISVCICNFGMLSLIKKHTGVHINDLLNKIKAYKLLILLLLLSTHLIFIILNHNFWIYSQIALFISSVIIFNQDIKELAQQMFSKFKVQALT